MNLKCKIFGHQLQPWYRTEAKAQDMHMMRFNDGVKCSRCNELIYIWDKNDNIVYQPKGTIAPKPIPRKEGN